MWFRAFVAIVTIEACGSKNLDNSSDILEMDEWDPSVCTSWS
jgi:hypothetical protein